MESIVNLVNQNMKSLEGVNSTLQTCSKCEEPIQKIINIFGIDRKVPVLCKCQKEELERKEKEERNREKQERLKRVYANSLMDEKFKRETFNNWNEELATKGMKNVAVKYSKNFNEIKKEGLGLLLAGNAGTGKTFMSNCIANDLLKRGIPVISVSINSILNRIKSSYSQWGKEGEDTVIKALCNADLLIIDDLGTEQDSEWSRSRIYSIIDSRYRDKLPLIISTNYSTEELEDKYNKRTMDRIFEMCTRINFTGQSIRERNTKTNADKLRELIRG